MDEETRTRYPEPIGVFAGTTQGIIPEVVADTVPIFTGAAKLPLTSDIWTVNNLWDNDTISVVLYSSDPCASPPTAASNDLIIHVKTGIADANTDGYITIYPNPNVGDFYVEAPIGSGNAEMTIVNSIGQVIFYKNRTVENGVLKERITLGNQIANGIYMLRIKTGSGVENIRFAIER